MASDSRVSRQLFWAVVHHRSLSRRFGHRIDRLRRGSHPALAHKPKIIVAGATAYSRTIDFAAFRSIADEVGAILWVDAAHFIGLVAGRAIPSCVPYADVVSATTHKVLRGPRGGMILCRGEHASAVDRAVFPFIQAAR